MSTIMYNATGTTSPSFAIGKKGRGIVLYQGITKPSDMLGNDGDVYISKGTPQRILNKVNGSWRDINSKSVTSISTSSVIDLDSSEQYYLVDSSVGPITITLGSASVISGYSVHVKDKAGLCSTNPITVTTENGESIDGETSAVLSIDYGAIQLLSDGTNWYIF